MVKKLLGVTRAGSAAVMVITFDPDPATVITLDTELTTRFSTNSESWLLVSVTVTLTTCGSIS